MKNPETAAASRFASKRSSFLVAAGIFLSRIAGLIRDRVFAHYFGNSDAADAFKAAFRIPNALQNLFGEGVLSASFIPVYAALLARDEEEEARRTAGAVAALLALSTSILVLIGVLATPYLIDAIAPGFSGEKRELTIRIVRILFPGAGLFVFSAWCLGILNSHRRFFLSYTAPVIWNAAMIGTLWGFGGRYAQFPLAIVLSWGSVVGSALRWRCNCPSCCGSCAACISRSPFTSKTCARSCGISFPCSSAGEWCRSAPMWTRCWRVCCRPARLRRWLTRKRCTRCRSACSACRYRRRSFRPCPARSARNPKLLKCCARASMRGSRQIAFFVIPSVAAFLVLGDVIVAAIYQSGRFTHADAMYVWGILAGSTVGLLASTLGRLYSSTYYALKDTRTPLRYAVLRVILTTVLGYLSAIPLPHVLGIESRWGVAGLTISAGISSWVEFALLRRTLNRRIGATGLPPVYLVKGLGRCPGRRGNRQGTATRRRSSQSDHRRDRGPRPVRNCIFRWSLRPRPSEVRALFSMFSRMRARSS